MWLRGSDTDTEDSGNIFSMPKEKQSQPGTGRSPVIVASREAEIRRIVDQSQLEQMVRETLS